MARLSLRKAKNILDFLARRAGYEKSLLTTDWLDDGRLNLFFCQGQCANAYETIEEIMIYDTGLKILGFHHSINEKDALELLLEAKNSIYVIKGPLAKNSQLVQKSRNVAPWMNVFLETDSLESLAIEADLDG